jgi:predicted small lipoprotein YifL
MPTSSGGPVTRRRESVLVALALFAVVAGCGERSPGPDRVPDNGRCDDSVRTTDEVPAAMREQGMPRGVGAGDVWFIDPQIARWGERVERRGNSRWAKLPVWVGSSDLPTIVVTGVNGTTGTGSVAMTPTADGLPGPVPIGVTMPGPGCWLVTATGPSGTARITVHAPSG